jgi:hypothetical protein
MFRACKAHPRLVHCVTSGCGRSYVQVGRGKPAVPRTFAFRIAASFLVPAIAAPFAIRQNSTTADRPERLFEPSAGPSGIPPWQPASLALRFPPTLGEWGPSGKDHQRQLPGRQGSSDAGQEVGQFGGDAVRGGGKRGALAPGWPPRCPKNGRWCVFRLADAGPSPRAISWVRRGAGESPMESTFLANLVLKQVTRL